MVRNANPSEKRRGRPPSYDSETVVLAAMTTFWSKGFDSTTLTELEAATGVDRSTLYYSFEGKEGLYRRAAAAYLDMAQEHHFASLTLGSEGVADIVSFLQRLRTELASADTPRGCLIVNDLGSPADHAATKLYLQLLRQGLENALERSAAAGETDADTVLQRSQLLCAAIVGVNLVSRTDIHNDLTDSLIDAMLAEVGSWCSLRSSQLR